MSNPTPFIVVRRKGTRIMSGDFVTFDVRHPIRGNVFTSERKDESDAVCAALNNVNGPVGESPLPKMRSRTGHSGAQPQR